MVALNRIVWLFVYSTKVNVHFSLPSPGSAAMDFYLFCEHCGKRVSEKTYKEHRRLYFHDGRWLVSHAKVEEISHHSDSTPLSISPPPESVGDDSSDRYQHNG